MSAAIVLPELYAKRLLAAGRNSGTLAVKWNASEELALIDGYRDGMRGTGRIGLSEVTGRHELRWASTSPTPASGSASIPTCTSSGCTRHSAVR